MEKKSILLLIGILIHQMFVQYHVNSVFGKPKGHSDAYEMSMKKILSLVSNELKEIHIVGGLHPDWKFEKYFRNS